MLNGTGRSLDAFTTATDAQKSAGDPAVVIHPGTVFEALRSSVQRAPSGSRSRFAVSLAACAGPATRISRAHVRSLIGAKFMPAVTLVSETVSAPDCDFVIRQKGDAEVEALFTKSPHTWGAAGGSARGRWTKTRHPTER